MPAFPDVFRDLAAFSGQGLEFSTPSDTAVKMLDALMNQVIYSYNHPQLGGFPGTAQKMFEADPDFVMGKIFTLGLQTFSTNPETNTGPRRKLFDLSQKSKKLSLTNLETMHLKAAELMASEDWYGVMTTFEDILSKYPQDIYALHMAYMVALMTGHTSRLRDTPASVIKEYKPGLPFYGNVHGKLSFGQEEMGEYKAAEVNGRLALDYLPLDCWATHALVHNFEESGRPLQGSKFLTNTESEWTMGSNFSHHIWWHKALLLIQQGDYEAALALYDDTIGPGALKTGSPFPLSDAASLLTRLHLAGVDIGDRAQDQAAAWEDYEGDFTCLFFDGHGCMANMMAGNSVENRRWLDKMKDYIQGDRQGWNKEVTEKVGLPLMEGITQFFNGDYSGAVATLAPVMPDVMKLMNGSLAQKDIFQQVLLQSCVMSGTPGNLGLARQIMEDKLVSRGLQEHTPVNKRFMEKIMSKHHT